MNPGRLPWAGMNDAFDVSTASAERPRVYMEEFCPAPPARPARIKLWRWRRPPASLVAVMNSWGKNWIADWLEGLGRVTLLAKESVASLLTFKVAWRDLL